MSERFMTWCWTLSLLALVACGKPTADPAPSKATTSAPVKEKATAPVPADEPAANPPAAAAAPHGPEIATFRVAGLDALMATRMAQALNELEGVRKARPEIAAGLLHVTFVPPDALPPKLTEVLKTVSPDVRLQGVRPVAPGAAHDHSACGSCPLKDSCQGK
jgi:hypothetical protein